MDTVTRHYDVEVELPGDGRPTYRDIRVGADVSAKDGELLSFELVEWAPEDVPWQSIDTLPAQLGRTGPGEGPGPRHGPGGAGNGGEGGGRNLGRAGPVRRCHYCRKRIWPWQAKMFCPGSGGAAWIHCPCWSRTMKVREEWIWPSPR